VNAARANGGTRGREWQRSLWRHLPDAAKRLTLTGGTCRIGAVFWPWFGLAEANCGERDLPCILRVVARGAGRGRLSGKEEIPMFKRLAWILPAVPTVLLFVPSSAEAG